MLLKYTPVTSSIQCPIFFIFFMCVAIMHLFNTVTPQWRAEHAEIKVPSVQNTELKGSLFKAWSRSVYCYTCSAYCQGIHPCQFLPFRSLHLHFLQNLSRVFPVLAVANTGSCVGLQNKIGHPAEQVPVLSACRI